MNILFEWIFWIFIKWIMFWTNILVLVCLRQKWLSPNVSNSSEITHGSLVGPISVHFSGLLPILGPQEGSAAITWPHLGILNNFPHFFLMNNSIEYSGLCWMKIWDFVLNWIIFRLNSMKIWIFKTGPISFRSAKSQQYMNVVDFSEMFLYLAPSLPAVGQIGAGKYIMCCPQIIYYEDV